MGLSVTDRSREPGGDGKNEFLSRAEVESIRQCRSAKFPISFFGEYRVGQPSRDHFRIGLVSMIAVTSSTSP
jgi:hypothetical protein